MPTTGGRFLLAPSGLDGGEACAGGCGYWWSWWCGSCGAGASSEMRSRQRLRPDARGCRQTRAEQRSSINGDHWSPLIDDHWSARFLLAPGGLAGGGSVLVFVVLVDAGVVATGGAGASSEMRSRQRLRPDARGSRQTRADQWSSINGDHWSPLIADHWWASFWLVVGPWSGPTTGPH